MLKTELHPIIGITASISILVFTTGNNIAYAEDPTDLDTISVTASKMERATKEVPAAISVIDKKQIEQSKMINIKDAIQGTPGVLIDSKNGGYDVRLIIRGAGQKANYGVREIMVLRDGVPMTDPDSFSRFDFIDTQDIERIEIEKGPGSLYASGSAGGTIHIISKSVFDTEANRLKLGYGEYGTENYHLRYGGDINESNVFALTTSRRVIDNGWRHWNKFDTNQVGFKHGLLLPNDSTLETELSYSEANIQLPGSMSDTQWDIFKLTGEQTDTQDAWKHSGRYSKILFFNSRLEQKTDDFVFKPRFYYNRWSHYHPVTGVINDNPGTDVLGTDLEFSHDHELFGNSTLVTGVTGRLDSTRDSRKYEYQDYTTGFGGRITATLSDTKGALMETQDTNNTLYGVYAQETLRPSDNWTIDAGFRLDRSNFDIYTNQTTKYDYASGTYVAGDGITSTNKTFTLFSPRIGATYKLTEKTNLFAVVAQSDQVPSDSEIKKNPALNTSTSRNYEVGLKGRSKKWSYDLSVYNNKITDEIVSITDIFGETTFQNAGRTDKKGFEFAGRMKVADRIWIGANYAYSAYTFEEFIEDGNDRSGNQLPYVPQHQYRLSADYEHPSGLKAGLQADTWGEYYMDNANSEKYEGYGFVTNLVVGYEKKSHSFLLNVSNLFDQRYATEVKKAVMGPTTKYYYYPGAPRTVMLTYRYTF